MIHTTPSTKNRRTASFAFFTFILLGTMSPVAAQQIPFPTADIRHDSNAVPATFTAETLPAGSPLTAMPGGTLSAPPPQLLKLPGDPVPVVTGPQAEAAPAVELTPRDGKSQKKLALPGSRRDGEGAAGTRATQSGVAGVFSVLAGLGVVLGLFLFAAYLMRRGMPKQGRLLPREAVESLGRIPFPGRQQGQLLRVGNKLVLVSFSNSGGADVITEITDPLEVDRLAGMCAQADRYSSTKSFRDIVEQFFGEKPKRPEPPHRALGSQTAASTRPTATSRFKESDVA